jgi:hypothetical protein
MHWTAGLRCSFISQLGAAARVSGSVVGGSDTPHMQSNYEKQKWTKTDDETLAVLQRWRGTKVCAWDYCAGHGRFMFRFFPVDGHAARGSAFLSCLDCQVVQLFHTGWERADISVSRAAHHLGTVFTITDPGRLQVVCYGVSVAETDGSSVFYADYPPK